jgi:hypothetical protein
MVEPTSPTAGVGTRRDYALKNVSSCHCVWRWLMSFKICLVHQAGLGQKAAGEAPQG